MRSPAKGFAFLFIAAFAVLTNTAAQQSQPDNRRKIPIGKTVPITVPYPANVAVPIHFSSQDYTGPYDPADPKGISAAIRRHMRIEGRKRAEVVKSYIPPGMDKFAKKELVHLAVGEGKRFAVKHPKETAEIIGIATRMKNLAHAAGKKVKEADEAQGNKKFDRH